MSIRQDVLRLLAEVDRQHDEGLEYVYMQCEVGKIPGPVECRKKNASEYVLYEFMSAVCVRERVEYCCVFGMLDECRVGMGN